jgi:microcystin-dependent protein
MANYEATRYDFDGANLTGIEGTATGTILAWTDTSVPSGFLECDGSAVSRSTYSGLFAVIGTTYGAGNGSTTFDLPDLQDNVPVGKSGTKSLASVGGANTVAATGNVGGSTANATLSTAQLASHSHPILRGIGSNPQGGSDPVAAPTSGSGMNFQASESLSNPNQWFRPGTSTQYECIIYRRCNFSTSTIFNFKLYN